jgi:hypothetical protein
MTGLSRRLRPVYQLAAVVLLAGCDPVSYGPPVRTPEAIPVRSVDGPAGTVTGWVTWPGPVPAVAPFLAQRGIAGITHTHLVPNPGVPVVDPATRGLVNAVVFLRGVDPARSKPWCHPAVTVEVNGDDLIASGGPVGFVPVGGSVTFVSRESFPQMVRGRGDDFFSFALPDPNQPRARTFESPGSVELSSGAGQYWMRAELVVCEHPYYAATDGKGGFMFDKVPPGTYELVVRHRNWADVRRERDPDTGLVARMQYAEPFEVVRSVTILPGGTVDVSIELGQPATK